MQGLHFKSHMRLLLDAQAYESYSSVTILLVSDRKQGGHFCADHCTDHSEL